jgi:hypothetical protein
MRIAPPNSRLDFVGSSDVLKMSEHFDPRTSFIIGSADGFVVLCRMFEQPRVLIGGKLLFQLLYLQRARGLVFSRSSTGVPRRFRKVFVPVLKLNKWVYAPR